MKRRFVIILSIQTLFIILLVLFSVIQKAEADLQRELAVQQREFAQQQRILAEEERRRAEIFMQEAAHTNSVLQAKLDSAVKVRKVRLAE